MFSNAHGVIDMARKSNLMNNDVLDSMDKVVASGKGVHKAIQGEKLLNLAQFENMLA